MSTTAAAEATAAGEKQGPATSAAAAAPAHMLNDLGSFLRGNDCTPDFNDLLESIVRCNKEDLETTLQHCDAVDDKEQFVELVAECATTNETTMGAQALAKLLPFFQEQGCPELACFCVTTIQTDDDYDKNIVVQEGKEILQMLSLWKNAGNTTTTNDEETTIISAYSSFCRRDPDTGIILIPGYRALVEFPVAGVVVKADESEEELLPPSSERQKHQIEQKISVIYLPVTDRRGLIQAFSCRPELAQRIAELLIAIANNSDAAPRILNEPILAQLYGAIVTCRNHESQQLREMNQFACVGIGKAKTKLHRNPKKDRKKLLSPEEDCLRLKHLECIDKLLEDSRKDPEAVQDRMEQLQKIVEEARTEGKKIQYLCAMEDNNIDADTLKIAIRNIGSEGNFQSELDTVVCALYVVESPPPSSSDESNTTNSIAFCYERPASIAMAFGLMFQLFGVNDILIKTRPLLMLCLRITYDFKVASAKDRNGVDPSIVVLACERLKNFTDMEAIGLEKGEDGEWTFKEIQSHMNNPYYMRLLLRAHGDFGIIRCEDYVNTLRELYRSRALLQLINKHGGGDGVTLVMKSPVNSQDVAEMDGEATNSTLELDEHTVRFSWKYLFSIDGIPAALGLNPHVINLLLEKSPVLGLKLKLSIAPALLERFKLAYDVPSHDTVWELLARGRSNNRLKTKVKGVYHLTPGSKEFEVIRNSLWEKLEKEMRIKLTLRTVDDEDAIVTCWICTEQSRVGARDFWVDLTDCCAQALCARCFDKSTRLDELPLRLVPRCPFCAGSLNLQSLDRFLEPDASGNIQGRGETVASLQARVRLDDGDGSFCSPEDIETLNKSHYFSSCRQCNCAIATRRQCVAHTSDLPDTCRSCIRSGRLDVRKCPKCMQLIERVGSFNDVPCVCGQHICWVCGGAVSDRDCQHYIFGYYTPRCAKVKEESCPKRPILSAAKQPARASASSPSVTANRIMENGVESRNHVLEFKDQCRDVTVPARGSSAGGNINSSDTRPACEVAETNKSTSEVDGRSPPRESSGRPSIASELTFKDQCREVPSQARGRSSAGGNINSSDTRLAWEVAETNKSTREIDGRSPPRESSGRPSIASELTFKDQCREVPSQARGSSAGGNINSSDTRPACEAAETNKSTREIDCRSPPRESSGRPSIASELTFKDQCREVPSQQTLTARLRPGELEFKDQCRDALRTKKEDNTDPRATETSPNNSQRLPMFKDQQFGNMTAHVAGVDDLNLSKATRHDSSHHDSKNEAPSSPASEDRPSSSSPSQSHQNSSANHHQSEQHTTMANTSKYTVLEFVKLLSAKQSTPGGGAAAAVSASIGSAAAKMAAEYSQRKKDRESGNAQHAESLVQKLECAKLIDAADDDAAAYADLQRSWKEEMSDDEKAKIEARALRVPTELLETCHQYILDIQAFLPYCNPNIVSDAKVGIHCLAGSARSAYATVLVNSPPELEKERLKKLLREIGDIEQQLLEL